MKKYDPSKKEEKKTNLHLGLYLPIQPFLLLLHIKKVLNN